MIIMVLVSGEHDYSNASHNYAYIPIQVELTALAPVLEKKSVETEELMQRLAVDQEEASKVRTVVVKEEAVANKKADETRAIAKDAQNDLDQALPALSAANKV